MKKMKITSEGFFFLMERARLNLVKWGSMGF